MLWLGLLDNYNWLEQYRLSQRLRQMRAQLEFYEKEIAILRQEKEALQSDPYTQEYYARQHYWVKRKGEKVYILSNH
ncbi:MAG: hypothetical protein RMJ66_02050 [Bacteroidia bacterium]|nr:hypothetical protein [Bacteroidia bacterium]